MRDHTNARLCVFFFLFLLCAYVHAQQFADWSAHNRKLAVQAQSLAQSHREQDTDGLTTDGSLNSEEGSVSGYSLQVRWQGAFGQSPLWFDLGFATVQGQTDYNGYLQRGSVLTPYRAKSGNQIEDWELRMGVPLSLASTSSVQLVPYVAWLQRRWQRNLLQYSETYRYSIRGLGLITQWQVAPGWVLEADYQLGESTPAEVTALTLGFQAHQAAGPARQAGLSLHYQITPVWGVQLKARRTQLAHGVSPIVNGLQAPPSVTTQTTLVLGVAFHF